LTHAVSNCNRQEGVADNIYERVELEVETTSDGNNKLACMAYKIRADTREKSQKEHGEKLLPSLRYKNVIIRGAKEHNLPDEYIAYLENIPDNGYNGEVDVNLPLTVQ
jgi:hypothetical protein